MSIHVQGVGHVVLKVRDAEASRRFYGDVLGLREVGRWNRMIFFSAGVNHHDLAVLEVGADAPVPPSSAVGIYHVALKIGDSLDVLREAKRHLEASGVRILGISDHRVSQSLYVRDPDGNGVELFVDADPAIWRDDPAAVATVGPLEL